MRGILRFGVGLVLVLTDVCKANMEYTSDAANLFSEYNALVDTDKAILPYKLINPDAAVRITLKEKISKDPNNKLSGLSFDVISNPINTHDAGTSSSIAPSEPTKGCYGKPGLKLNLNFFEKCFYSTKPEWPYCLITMGINVLSVNPTLDPWCAQLSMTFQSSKNKDKITISMLLFKPPKHKEDHEHATKTGVPHVTSSIILKDSTLRSTNEKVKEARQEFLLNDISWMRKVFKRARYHMSSLDKSKLVKESGFESTSFYDAGPVILDEEPFNEILRIIESCEQLAI